MISGNTLRIVFAGLLILHGAIHLVGFGSAWNLGTGSALSGKTLFVLTGTRGKIVGILWLIACILLMLAATLYLLRKENFWIVAVISIALSQTLIILYWQDARFGTIANLIALAVVIVSAATSQFNASVREESGRIIEAAVDRPIVVSDEEIRTLPSVVQRWLRYTKIVGKKSKNVVHLDQQGAMRTKPESKWMMFEATQCFSINPPAFIWHANIHAALAIDIMGRDLFENGKGNMLIKPLGLFTSANSSGAEIDEGTLIRFMAEMMWFPQAAVSDYLTWEQIDDHHASVTMRVHETVATGIYSFGDDGHVTGFEAQRYGDFDGQFRRETWSITVESQKVIGGVPIGNKSSVTWKLSKGNFEWLKLEVTNIY